MVSFNPSDVALALMAGAFTGAGMILVGKKKNQSGLNLIFTPVLVLGMVARSLNPQTFDTQFPFHSMAFVFLAMSVGSGAALAYWRIKKAGD